MQKSETIANLAAALVQAQPLVKTALMESTNPFFKSKYADLGSVWDAVREALKANGLAVTQLPDAINGAPALTTMLIHESGDWIAATYPLVVTSKDETAQGYGSAVTYARRYGLSALMGVIADTDDDGNAASKAPKPATAPSKPQPGGDIYAPEHVRVPEKSADRAAAAKAWALTEIPRIKTMDKVTLDKFCERFKKTREELKLLDGKTSIELEKAFADRLEALFA